MKFMNARVSIMFIAATAAFNSCGVQTANRNLSGKSSSTAPSAASAGSSSAISPANSSAAAAIPASAPKLMIARVAQTDLNSQSAKVDFVAVNGNVKIASAADAENAFNVGTTIQVQDGAKGTGLLLSGSNGVSYSVNILLPVSASASMNLMCSQGTTCGQPSAGCGGIGLCGGLIGFFGGIIRGVVSTVGSLLSVLNPFSWIGTAGYGYGYQNQYGTANYQYGVYQPVPGQVITQGSNGQPLPGQAVNQPYGQPTVYYQYPQGATNVPASQGTIYPQGVPYPQYQNGQVPVYQPTPVTTSPTGP